MNKYFLIPLCLLIISFLSCTAISSEFVRTGPTLSPLNKQAEVKVFLTSNPATNYTEIGILKLSGSDLQGRIIKAKEIARINGGNGIIPRDSKTTTQTGTRKESRVVNGVATLVDVPTSQSFESQDFIIIKLN